MMRKHKPGAKYCVFALSRIAILLFFTIIMSMRFKWFISWVFVFPLFKVLTGIEILGTIPKKGPFIIACNHVSFLDPPIVGITAFREVFFLAKVGLFRASRLFEGLIRSYNAIPISGTQGLRTGARLLRQGHVVVIFPEGTRSRRRTLLPFNPGVGYLAVTLGVPVIPAYITNSNKRFITLMLRINQLRIRFGSPIFPDGYLKNVKDLERFANKIREEVLKLK